MSKYDGVTRVYMVPGASCNPGYDNRTLSLADSCAYIDSVYGDEVYNPPRHFMVHGVAGLSRSIKSKFREVFEKPGIVPNILWRPELVSETSQPLPEPEKRRLYHVVDGVEVEGAHGNIWGEISPNLYGDCSNIQGDVTSIYGRLTDKTRGYFTKEIKGDVRGLSEDVSGYSGYIDLDCAGKLRKLPDGSQSSSLNDSDTPHGSRTTKMVVLICLLSISVMSLCFLCSMSLESGFIKIGR